MIRKAYVAEQAVNGQEVVTDTANHKGSFTGMLVIADTVVASMSWKDGYSTGAGSLDWSEFTSIPAGAYLPGDFTDIELTSGEVILIRK